jgi:hypothetical protein
MNRRRYRLLWLLSIPALAATTAAPALAATAAAATAAAATTTPSSTSQPEAGFVHFDPALGLTTTFTSNGRPATVTKDSSGREVVRFPGLTGLKSGQVSLSGDGSDIRSWCSVQDIGRFPILGTPQATDVEVACFDGRGNIVDQPFDLLVTGPHSKPAGMLAYEHVGGLTATVVAQFNSAGKRNSVTRVAPGIYDVTMPGAGSAGNDKGTVKVSLASDEPGMCQIGSWATTKNAQKINVRCFDETGAPADRDFFVTYARGNNLMGQRGLIAANAKVQAVGRAPVYQPATQFDSQRGARITVAHLDRGRYLVFFAGSSGAAHPNGGNGDIQITPIATGYRRCVESLISGHTPHLRVVCADRSGAPRDTAFTVQWVVA